MPQTMHTYKPHSETIIQISVLAGIFLFILNISSAWCQDKGGWSLGHSEETRTPKVNFIFHPTPIFVSLTYKLGCEYSVGPSWSGRTILSVGHPKNSYHFEVYDRRSVGIEGQLRRYFKSHQWQGWYGAVFVLGKYMAFNTLPTGRVGSFYGLIESLNQYPYVPDEYNASEASAFALGPMLGYQFTIDMSFTIDLYAGAGFQAASITGGGTKRMKADHTLRSRSNDAYSNGLIVHSGLSIGLLFY
jgi:hypothetical protein